MKHNFYKIILHSNIHIPFAVITVSYKKNWFRDNIIKDTLPLNLLWEVILQGLVAIQMMLQEEKGDETVCRNNRFLEVLMYEVT